MQRDRCEHLNDVVAAAGLCLQVEVVELNDDCSGRHGDGGRVVVIVGVVTWVAR